jgi:prepilin-type processing-associated H-X9-DG protein
MDQAALYNEYRFDEPWDGPNNRKLAARVSRWSFHCDSDEPAWEPPDALMTSFLAVVGPGMAWQEGKCTRLSDITDDPDSTLLLVEVANSGVHWMEPRDLDVLQMAPTINAKAGQGIASRHPGGAHAATAGGHVQFLSDKLPAATIRGLLTINGGERISDNDF